MIYLANRPILLFIIHLIITSLAGFTFSLLENKSIEDGMYWAYITVLTIGYGDVLPTLGITKIMSILLGYFGLFTLSCIIANILGKLIVDKDSFTDEEQEFQEDALRKIANKLGITLNNITRKF